MAVDATSSSLSLASRSRSPRSAATNSATSGTTAQATPSVSLTYGTNHSQFNNGKLITMVDGVGSETYSYNALEQLTQLQKVIDGTTYVSAYSDNIAGELTQITYPSNRIVQQSVDAIGRLCEIAPSTTGCGTAASPYATAVGYNAANQLIGFKYGNGVYASFGLSADRLLLTCLDYSTTNRSGVCTHDSTTKFGLSYSYSAAPNNNGQINSIADSVDNGRSVTYTYDALYRMSRAVSTGSANYPAWGLGETYDRYANRSAQSIYSGCVNQTCPTNSEVPNTTTNQLGAPNAYDAAGNMTSDGLNALVYDAENHVVSSGAGTYTYDGNGLRVKKVSGGNTTVYIFSGSKVIAEYQNGASPSSPTREYIYRDATLLAKIDSTGTKYYHQDHMSNRLITDSSGNTNAQMGHFPFGEMWYNTANDKLAFTTYERDAESGNDYAMARTYVSRLGRMSSPDVLAGNVANPQSLNRYAYVANDPAELVDPSGACIYVVRNPGSTTPSQQDSGAGPGPSAPDVNVQPAYGEPQQSDCSVSLDGGDITNYGGGPGFAIGGGGNMGGGLNLIFTGSANFHWEDYSLDELLQFAEEGEIGVDLTFVDPSAGPTSGPGGPGGPNGPNRKQSASRYVDEKVLADCIKQLFPNVQITYFKDATPGGSGFFMGTGPDLRASGMRVVPVLVSFNASSYSEAQISQKAGTEAFGYTDPRFPYQTYGNNNNNAVGTLLTQVHELGHALFQITQVSSPLVPEPNEMGNALEDCVKNHHGIKQ